MARRISLVGLIEQKWIRDGSPGLEWNQLLRRTIEADKELERAGINRPGGFRKHRKVNNLAKMNKYIQRGFHKYKFYPRHVMKVTNPKGKALAFQYPLKPDKNTLVNLYNNLYKEHPHHLLPLDTELPNELDVASRDQYRIILTMVLSERRDDYTLSTSLWRFFQKYPSFESLRSLSKQQIIEKILAKEHNGGCGFGGYNKPHGGGNDDRLTTFLNRHFGVWKRNITRQHIRDLLRPKPTGFGPKFIRTLLAYCPLDRGGSAERNVLPLDNPAFKALNDHMCRIKGGYKYTDLDDARGDIERKLRDEKNISLISFHELLRFKGQTEKNQDNERAINRVIIGWNAWRILCSKEREKITKDRKWIYKNLVNNDEIAEKLWSFVKKITSY